MKNRTHYIFTTTIILILCLASPKAHSFNRAWASWEVKESAKIADEKVPWIATVSGTVGASLGYMCSSPNNKGIASVISGLVCTAFGYLISKVYSVGFAKKQLHSLYNFHLSETAPCHIVTNPADTKSTVKKYRLMLVSSDTAYPYLSTEQYLINLKQVIIDVFVLIEKVASDNYSYKSVNKNSLTELYDRINTELYWLRQSAERQKEFWQRAQEERLRLERENLQANTMRQTAESKERQARAEANYAEARYLNTQVAKDVIDIFSR